MSAGVSPRASPPATPGSPRRSPLRSPLRSPRRSPNRSPRLDRSEGCSSPAPSVGSAGSREAPLDPRPPHHLFSPFDHSKLNVIRKETLLRITSVMSLTHLRAKSSVISSAWSFSCKVNRVCVTITARRTKNRNQPVKILEKILILQNYVQSDIPSCVGGTCLVDRSVRPIVALFFLYRVDEVSEFQRWNNLLPAALLNYKLLESVSRIQF
ncbi:unnamed protein product [Leptidea sinapis]|uniref:Uncharacterized protein n=1 Tax=Leptidea sinapis TaxID=189913 RepID=A0A5E4QHW9_9NEOP|nr:unnamed protein product [Leptidea sinapis]